MVFDVRKQTGQHRGAIARVGRHLDINPETLRQWVRQAEVDDGVRPGRSTDDAQYIAELECDLAEERRANAILRAAASFFARKFD